MFSIYLLRFELPREISQNDRPTNSSDARLAAANADDGSAVSRPTGTKPFSSFVNVIVCLLRHWNKYHYRLVINSILARDLKRKNEARSVLDIQASRTPFRRAIVNQKKPQLTNFEQIMDTFWTEIFLADENIHDYVHLASTAR